MEHLLLELLRGTPPAPAHVRPAVPALALVAVFLTIAGSVFLLTAGYNWMLTQYDSQTASVYMGAAALIAAGGCVLVAGIISYGAKVKKRVYRNAVINRIYSMVEGVVSELEEPIQEHPKTAAALASVAGFVAAEKLLH